jgi:hypothetical protein
LPNDGGGGGRILEDRGEKERERCGGVGAVRGKGGCERAAMAQFFGKLREKCGQELLDFFPLLFQYFFI